MRSFAERKFGPHAGIVSTEKIKPGNHSALLVFQTGWLEIPRYNWRHPRWLTHRATTCCLLGHAILGSGYINVY